MRVCGQLYDLRKSWKFFVVFLFDLSVLECSVARQVRIFHGLTDDFRFFMPLTQPLPSARLYLHKSTSNRLEGLCHMKVLVATRNVVFNLVASHLVLCTCCHLLHDTEGFRSNERVKIKCYKISACEVLRLEAFTACRVEDYRCGQARLPSLQQLTVPADVYLLQNLLALSHLCFLS